ncbi:MAG: hypothetical protein IT536_05080 [Hyphomicrobiales bacterium]|nr:hypothetical protein [Hyphomicrobiales bacterium]
MAKSNSVQGDTTDRATQADLHVLGDLDDETKVAILALNPTVAQIEQAGIWLNSRGEVASAGRPGLDAVVSQILDLVDSDEEEDPLLAG